MPNPVEHAIGLLSMTLMILAAHRDEPKVLVIEDEIRKSRSIKKSMEEHKDRNPEYVTGYKQVIESPHSLIEDAFRRT